MYVCMYNVTLRCLHATIFAVESNSISHSEVVFVTLGIQHAIRMSRIV